MLEDGFQSFGRGVEHHQLVVEAQRILDVELRDATIGRQIVDRAIRLGRGDRADLGADTAAVLQRHHERIRRLGAQRLDRGIAVRVGGEIAEVGFLGTHLRAFAFEIDRRVPQDVAILGADHRLHRIDEGLDLAALGAGGEGRGRELG